MSVDPSGAARAAALVRGDRQHHQERPLAGDSYAPRDEHPAKLRVGRDESGVAGDETDHPKRGHDTDSARARTGSARCAAAALPTPVQTADDLPGSDISSW